MDEITFLHVTRGSGPDDEQLAAAMEEVYEAGARDPNRWHNNPEEQREALEGLVKLLAKWQDENGAFTQEELARARARKSGVNLRS